MGRPLLALLRGRDGRSLAWALALLVALNAFVAGGHIGAADSAPLLCTTDMHTAQGGDVPGGPAQADPCCVAGCISAATGLAGGEATSLVLPPETRPVFLPTAASIAIALPRIAGHGPRGPPSLA